MKPEMAEQKCKDCGHLRRVHSIKGCLNNGMCIQGCQNKYMDKDRFE
jgi:hypothetical protein